MRTIVVGLFAILIAIMFLAGLAMLPGSGASTGLGLIVSAFLMAMIVDTWRVSQETRDQVRESMELLKAVAARIGQPRTTQEKVASVARRVAQEKEQAERVAMEAISDSRPDDWGPVATKLR